MDPRDPKVLYAAAYARRSDRFDDFDSVGIAVLEGGGVYKTTDGGDTWKPLTRWAAAPAASAASGCASRRARPIASTRSSKWRRCA